jgi:hypothetical protein
MNHHHLKRSAIKALLIATLLGFASASWAAVAGRVTNLSGPLIAKKADGKVKVLALKSEVEEGDTLVSEKNTYAQIRFVDNSEITLRPGTTFKVESFAFEEGKPDDDKATFNLVKGGLRSVSGLLGKRNKEKFAMKTQGATIGIRGTTFVAEWVEGEVPETSLASNQAWLEASVAMVGNAGLADVKPLQLAQNVPAVKPPSAPGLAPGLYVSVIDGAINLSNKGGSQNFSAGQFGYTANVNKPPVVVPANPGLKFTPPPTFSTNTGSNSSSSASKSNAVDCEVR